MPSIEVVHPDAPAADALVRAYMLEVASRYYGRPATAAEVERALLDEPSDDLQEPTGVLLVAMEDGAPVACAGARFAGNVAELTKVFTLPAARGRGLGALLLTRMEDDCRSRGIVELRLDTRAELAEACALYERMGFSRTDPFNDEPYSDRWYAKRL